MTMKKQLALLLFPLLLVGCDALSPYGTSNIPEPTTILDVHPQMHPTIAWQEDVGYGSRGSYLRLAPCIQNNVVYNVDLLGVMYATSAQGNHLWKKKFKVPGKSDLAGSDNQLAFVDAQATLHVVNAAQEGKEIWHATLSDQALAAPTFTADKIFVKTIDGSVTAFNRATGEQLWQYQHAVSTLMLRASSPVSVVGNVGYVGFSDGKVVALNLATGDEIWSQQAAEAKGFSEIERLIDIDANLIVKGQRLYVATYQGDVSALDVHTGKILWQQPSSVYADITLDNDLLYAIAADGTMTAYNANNGKIVWTNKTFAWHFLTGPTLFENNLVMGDEEGHVYFVNPKTGTLLGQTKPYKDSKIISHPLVLGQEVIVVDTLGELSAITL